MSAYAHQMEREFSAQSLSSRGNSEVGSQYIVETGFYMTSFAGTIFIAALVTIGVLLITLLIALSVMLQSCQSRNSGLVEIPKSSDDHSYCKIFAQHAELNNLEVAEFPSVCRDFGIEYIREGQYWRDLNFTMWMIESYFSSLTPLDDGLDVVLMDVDEISASDLHPSILKYRFDVWQCGYTDCIEDARNQKHMLILKLYLKLRSKGWLLIFISRKHENERNSTLKHLISVGYTGWSSLIMRLDEEMQMNTHEYFSKRRTAMQEEDFRIAGVISSRMDALTGPYLGKRIFKLPNLSFYNLEGYTETRKISL